MTINSLRSSRSEFVTGLAWVLIVLAGLTAVTSAGQNMMVWLFPFGAELSWFRLVLFMVFVLSVVTLVAGFGLHHRRDWARVLVSLLLVVGMIAMVGMTLVAWAQMPSGMMRDGAFDAATTAIQVYSLAFSVVATGAMAWVVKKLNSFEIRSEFVGQRTT